MFSKDRLIDFMKNRFDLVIDEEDIGEEVVLLNHEELEDELIPKEVLQILSNPTSYQTYIYNNESEWVIGIALEAETNNPLFLVCLKDGKKIFQQYL